MSAEAVWTKILGPVVLLLTVVSVVDIVRQNQDSSAQVRRLHAVTECFNAYNVARDHATAPRVDASNKESHANRELLLAFAEMARKPPKDSAARSRALLLRYAEQVKGIDMQRDRNPIPAYPDCTKL